MGFEPTCNGLKVRAVASPVTDPNESARGESNPIVSDQLTYPEYPAMGSQNLVPDEGVEPSLTEYKTVVLSVNTNPAYSWCQIEESNPFSLSTKQLCYH